MAPLQVADFRLLLAGFALGQMLMPLQFFTQILWVQAYAPRDIWLILVALIGASRGIGALTFGLYGGALADRYDRRWLLLVMQCLLVAMTLLIALIMHLGQGSTLAFGLFFLATFLSAGLQSIDAPTRLALVPDILGAALTPAGMSLNQVAGQLAMPVAIFGTGLIIEGLGFSGAYLFSALGHLLMIVCLLLMKHRGQRRQDMTGSQRYGFLAAINDIRFGLAYTRNDPLVLWVILLLVAMMGLGFPATANLGPTWLTTVVGVSIANVGFVAMAWGIGALMASIALTFYPNVEQRGLLIAGGALLFSCAFLVFVLDHTVTNAVLGNLGLGAGMTITMVSSTILIQRVVAPEVRGRIMSILQLNMGFAQLMTMPVAALAQWMTLQVLFPVMALTTLLAVAAILVTQPQLARARLPPIP
ncbi:MAG: MFS transporter [Pseudomonadota bacterium]